VNSKNGRKRAGPAIRKNILRGIQGTGDRLHAMMDTATERITTILHRARTVGTPMMDAVTEAAGAAVHGTVEAGGDLGKAAKGILVGVLRGTRETGEAGLTWIAHTTETVIRQTAQVGGDVGVAAKGLVQGAIHCAKDLGLDASRTASRAAQTAFEAAEEVGSASASRVRDALAGTMDGIPVLLRRPFQHHSRR
jgi:ElaB/YqjD/DUF883 family membrane-anchored ribosome-binding protein